MKRYALLIEASKVAGESEIRGCVRDVERMRTWLSNNVGGGWENTEIEVLNNPASSKVKAAKQRLDNADFAFVQFSGHGEMVEDNTGRRRQMILLGCGTEVDFDDLRPRALRAVMLCDACRNIRRSKQFSLQTKAAVLYEAREVDASRAEYRKYFEDKVSAAPAGNFTMYSCSINESAGEDPLNGGCFTDALITLAGEWQESRSSNGVLSINDAFDSARSFVQTEYSSQNPVGGPSDRRRGNPFPFGLKLVRTAVRMARYR